MAGKEEEKPSTILLRKNYWKELGLKSLEKFCCNSTIKDKIRFENKKIKWED